MDEQSQQPFSSERQSMVEEQLRRRGIRDERVLAAMRKVPRHEFVDPERWPDAYADRPVTIAERQTTSQPYIIASMLQAAEIQPQHRVLEIGAGSGYQTAVLAELAAQVIAVERYPSLARAAEQSLQGLGYAYVVVVVGDGSLGAPQFAPYNAIIVSAAAPDVPPALLEQLAPGGRLVLPVGNLEEQVLKLVHKHRDGSVTTHAFEGCRFVPLIGEQGFAA